MSSAPTGIIRKQALPIPPSKIRNNHNFVHGGPDAAGLQITTQSSHDKHVGDRIPVIKILGGES